MFSTINVLIMKYFKDKLRKAAIGLHKLLPYSKSTLWFYNFVRSIHLKYIYTKVC